MQKEARGAAANRATPMSPGTTRRLQRRELYHSRRAALAGAQNPASMQNAPPMLPQENPIAMNVGASAMEGEQTVPMMGVGLPLGSQEPRQVCHSFPTLLFLGALRWIPNSLMY
jgi:hypothetical protein